MASGESEAKEEEPAPVKREPLGASSSSLLPKIIYKINTQTSINHHWIMGSNRKG
jgi:hypothetical protein